MKNNNEGIEYQYFSNLIADEYTSVSDAIHVLTVYLRLHEGKIGSHWLWAAIERIVAGDKESEVLENYGYVYYDGDNK